MSDLVDEVPDGSGEATNAHAAWQVPE